MTYERLLPVRELCGDQCRLPPNEPQTTRASKRGFFGTYWG